MSTKSQESTLQLARDARNLVQALVALRLKRVYLPSLFAYYTVNSACNLRCSYCYIGQPEIFPQGFANAGLPLERAKRVLATLGIMALLSAPPGEGTARDINASGQVVGDVDGIALLWTRK